MRILILDDDKDRHDGFAELYANDERVHVYTAEHAAQALDSQDFDAVYLDHDLNGTAYAPSSTESGYAAAVHITHMAPERRPKKVFVHSWNPPGAYNMVRVLRRAGVDVVYKPYWIGYETAAEGCEEAFHTWEKMHGKA
jgi:CheY-like chemotaxis protein